jgi:hypothetical protein
MKPMPDRRTTLKIGATGMLAALVNLPGQSLANASRVNKSKLLPSHILFDSQYLESQNFAAAIKDNLSSVWYQQLRQQLSQNRAPVLGMTSRLELFCLEELARDVGMQVSLRVDHLIDKSGSVEHLINGLPFNGLNNESGFGTAMAELVDLPLPKQMIESSAQKLTGPFTPKNKTALVTWIIS